MAEIQTLLRRWFTGLTEDDCIALAHAVPSVRRTFLGHPGGPGRSSRGERRAAPKVRKHLTQAADARLAEIAGESLPAARRELLDLGYPAEQVDHPDADQLRQMLLRLSPVHGRLALFGLLGGNAPATPTARANATELLALLGVGDMVQADPVQTDSVPPDPATSDYVGPEPALAASDWAAVRDTVARLGSEAVALAARLRAEADLVEAGRRSTDAGRTAAILIDFAADLEHILADVERADPAAAGVDSLDGVLEAAAAADLREQSERDRERQLEELLANRAELERSQANASPGMRAVWDAALAALDGELAALGPSAAPLVDLSPLGRQPEPENEPDMGTDAGPDTQPVAENALPADPVPPMSAAFATAVPDFSTDSQSAGPAASPPTNGPPVVVTPEPEISEPETPQPETPQPEVTAPEPGSPGEPDVRPACAPVATAPACRPAEPTESHPSHADGDGDAAERLAFPWDAGDPPFVVELVSQGRLAEAYWVTAAADEVPVRAHVLRLACAAFATNGADAAGAVLTRWEIAAAGTEIDREAFLVELVALLRCGLAAGWSHRYPQLELANVTLPNVWQAFVAAASEAVQKKCRIEQAAPIAGGPDVERTRVELGRAARKLREELPRRKTKYQRATLLLPQMLHKDEPLGGLLELVIAWAEGDDAGEVLLGMRERLDDLSGTDALTELIAATDAANRGPTQRERIHSGALRQLERAGRQVIDRGREAVALAGGMTGPQDGATQALRVLHKAAAAVATADRPHGAGGAALGLLALWVQDPTQITLPVNVAASNDLDDQHPVSTDSLLVLPELPRDGDRQPLVDDPESRHVLARLADRLEPAQVLATYCETGALDLAERLLELHPAAGPAASIEAAEQRWRGTLRRSREGAQALLDRLQMQNLMTSPAEISRISGRLAAPLPEGRAAYDLREAELRQLRVEMQAVLDDYVTQLRSKTSTEVGDVVLRSRIEALLADYDLVTANEFLAAHLKGDQITSGGGDPVAQLREFVTVLDRGVERPPDPEAWTAAFGSTDMRELPESVQFWLADWKALESAKGVERQRAVQGVLRLIGLDPVPGTVQELRISRSFVQAFDVSAAPRDGSVIAELGTNARGRYKVLVVRDARIGAKPLNDLDRTSVDIPTIVFYLSAMSREQRAKLAKDARERRANAIVIDPVVVGWLAARAPSSFRATQRVTLPWSAYEPYRPFMAGLVPSEVFVGREAERREIVDPDGAVFVYGGRQLGKSALLRQIQAAPGSDRTVVYLDLKGLGIGEAEKPDRIWIELAAALKEKGVVRSTVSARPGAEVVVKEIRDWLDKDDSRRLLLLADEADAFLTADSRELPTTGGTQNFPTMNRLKELMERTNRRFKFVFAGLHQVQRFVHLSNVPTPHGGSVPIGPLEPADARGLVVDPLAALGYTFERPDLVWRLLAATNYQPAPIQIFCRELLAHMRRTRDGRAPVLITAEDVDRTAWSREVREPIAERTRITFNLEDRYRVLAMLIARKSLDDGFARSYPAAELLEEAAEIWSDGFRDAFDERRLAVYLDEMVGLGLLVRSGQRTYAMRSPNVVGMLGSREDFDRELAGSDFDLPYEYNPRLSRRLLGRGRNGERRSPLPDAELQNLVDTARSGVVPLVTGPTALTIDRLPTALGAYLDARGETVVTCTPEDLKRLLTDEPTAQACIVLDLQGIDAPARDAALDRAVKGSVPVVALVDPDAAQQLQSDGAGEIVRPDRWSADSIRSWPDCPFDTPDRRRRLIRVTGGWPEMVELAVHQALQQGRTTDTALDTLHEQFPADQAQAAATLAGVGIDDELADVLHFWAQATEPGEALPRKNLPGVLSLDAAAAASLESRLHLLGVLTEEPTGIHLDELTHRCLNKRFSTE